MVCDHRVVARAFDRMTLGTCLLALAACNEESAPGGATASSATASTSASDEVTETGGPSSSMGAIEVTTSVGTGTTDMATPGCGDGVLDPGEGCDDGNAEPGDGCDAACVPMATVEWTYTHNGGADNDDSAAAVAIDPSGRVIVVGAEVVQTRDALILALAPDGAELWRKTVDAAGFADEFFDVAIDADGRIYVAGYEEIEAGIESAVVRAYEADGTAVWKFSEEPPEPGLTRVEGLALADGALYSTGSEAGLSAMNLVIRRHALATGAAAWKTSTLAGATSAHAGGIAASGAEMLAAGHVELAQEAHPLLVRVDHGGTIRSEAIELERRGAWADAATVGGDGDVVVSGRLAGADEEFDVAVRRVAIDGMVRWTHTADHMQRFDAGRSVAVGAGEELFVAGVVTTASADREIFGGRLSGTGEPRWRHVHANRGAGLDDLGAGAAFGAGFVILAGAEQAPGEGANVWVRRFSAE